MAQARLAHHEQRARPARRTDLGTGYHNSQNPRRQTRSRIREIERLNPGMNVTLTAVEPAA
jgi:hypothetical protein